MAYNFLSIAVIALGGFVAFRIFTESLSGREAEIGLASCVGLIAVASWLLRYN